MAIQTYDLGQGLALNTTGAAIPCHLTEEVGIFVSGTFSVGPTVTLKVSVNGVTWVPITGLSFTAPRHVSQYIVASNVRAVVVGGDGTTAINVTLQRGR